MTKSVAESTSDNGFLQQLENDRRDGGHSIFAPSSASRWMNCPHSLVANLLCEDSAGYDAALGTVAHGVAEEWLKSGKRPGNLIGEVEWVINGRFLFQIEIDGEMLDYVERYVTWCGLVPGDHYVEQSVDFSDLTPIPNQTGTADHVACDNGRLVITDLKYGKGVQVYAEKNPQLLIYAYGVFAEWDWLYGFDEIEVRIAQVRLGHFDTYVISRSDLMEFADYTRNCARRAWSMDAPIIAGDKQCTFCRKKAVCPALAKMTLDVARLMFADEFEIEAKDVVPLQKEIRSKGFSIKVPQPLTLGTEDLASLIRFRGTIEKWFKGIEIELSKRASEGIDVPGFKLVEGRSNRVFSNEQQAVNFIGQAFDIDTMELYSVKLMTPSQAETLLKNAGYRSGDLAELSKVVRKPPGKPTLVPLTDKRPALSKVIYDMWQDDDE